MYSVIQVPEAPRTALAVENLRDNANTILCVFYDVQNDRWNGHSLYFFGTRCHGTRSLTIQKYFVPFLWNSKLKMGALPTNVPLLRSQLINYSMRVRSSHTMSPERPKWIPRLFSSTSLQGPRRRNLQLNLNLEKCRAVAMHTRLLTLRAVGNIYIKDAFVNLCLGFFPAILYITVRLYCTSLTLKTKVLKSRTNIKNIFFRFLKQIMTESIWTWINHGLLWLVAQDTFPSGFPYKL